MSTQFVEIYDLSLVSFRDYQLDKVYSISSTDFNTILQNYMLKAIPKFTNCQTNLEDMDLINGLFNPTLSLSEKIILSDLLVIEWMTSKILDVTQLQNGLNDTDFKTYSQAQNLTGKINAQNMLRERLSQNMVDYGLKNVSWSDWASGNYG